MVFASRIGRDESRLKRMAATGFYSMMGRLARVPYQGQAGRLPPDVPPGRGYRPPDAGAAPFPSGMVAWVGFRQVPIEYRRAGRRSGRGASYPALMRLASEALTSFSDVPLSLATYTGVFAAGLSALGALTILVLTILGTIAPSVGVWVLVAVLFLGGIQLMSVGVLAATSPASTNRSWTGPCTWFPSGRRRREPAMTGRACFARRGSFRSPQASGSSRPGTGASTPPGNGTSPRTG